MKNTKAILTVLTAGLLSHTIGLAQSLNDLPSPDSTAPKPAHVLKAPQTLRELSEFRTNTNLRNVGGVRERITTTRAHSAATDNGKLLKYSRYKMPDYVIYEAPGSSGEVFKQAVRWESHSAKSNFLHNSGSWKRQTNWKWDLRPEPEGDKRYQYITGLCFLDGAAIEEDDAEGFKWLLWAAKQGHVGAQNAVATCYFNGEGVQADENKAAQWWKKASEGEDPLALWTRGWMQYETPELAIESWKASARKGFYEAQVDLAAVYLWGIEVEVDIAEAFKWISLAMVSGNKVNPLYDETWREWLNSGNDPNLFEGLKYNDPEEGFYYLYNGIHWWGTGNPDLRAEGERRALEFFHTNKFHPVLLKREQECYYGSMGEYHPNLGFVKFHTDLLKAAHALKLHEVKEHVDTWHTRRDTGYQYMLGQVVPRNLSRAYMYIAVALIEWLPEDEYWARGGKFEANRELLDSISSLMTPEEIALGQFWAKELATELDLERTSEKVETLRRSIEVGNPVAKRTLAGYYFSGEQGVLRDYKRGVALLRNVADQGNAGAQFDLGMCYILGRGVERNDLTGKEWLLKASKSGSTDAKKVLVSDWPEEFAKVWPDLAKDLGIDPSLYL